MAEAKQKVAVSGRALFQRINRKLKGENRQIRTARGFFDGSYWHEDTNLGRYYVLDLKRNFVVVTRVDLEDFGRKLGVLAEGEELKGEE
jgi:hypothetical protein